MQPKSIDTGDTDSAEPPRQGRYLLSLYPAESDRELRLADLWHVTYDGKWIVLLAILLCTTIAMVIAALLPPVYRAEVLMAPVIKDGGGGGLAALAGQFGGLASIAGLQLNDAATNRAQAIATLQSRLLTERFIRDRNLAPVLFPEVDDAEGEHNNDDNALPPTGWELYQKFDSLLNVSEELETGLITLTVDWTGPDQAAAWANGLVAEVNQHLRNKAIEEAEENLQFLKGELENFSAVEVQSAIFSLMEAEMKNAMLANVRMQYAFEVIDPAVPPEKQFKPRRSLIAVVGFAGGAFLGLLIVFLRHAIAAPPADNHDDK